MTYALYAWGNFIDEVQLDRDPGWLEPAVLRGERDVVADSLMIGEIVTTWKDEHGQWSLALVRLTPAA